MPKTASFLGFGFIGKRRLDSSSSTVCKVKLSDTISNFLGPTTFTVHRETGGIFNRLTVLWAQARKLKIRKILLTDLRNSYFRV